jgi:hypothetical protein
MSDDRLLGNTKSEWIAKLFYDSEGAGEYLSFSHSQQALLAIAGKVYPFLSNEPSIRRSIDLKDCVASVSNVTLELDNANYRNAPLWDELNPFSATRKYLNRKVIIYERLNQLPSFEVLFTGRTRSINLDRKSGKVRVVLEPNQPWDFLSIPNAQTTDTGRYFPVVYGLYTPNTSTQSSRSICASRALWPCEVDRVSQDFALGLAHKAILADAHLHVFEESTQQFVPVSNSSGSLPTISNDYQGGESILADAGYYQGWIFKPSEYGGSSTVDFADPEYAHDFPLAEDSTTEATDTLVSTNGLGDTGNLYLGLPSLKRPGSQTSTTVKIKVRWEAVTAAGSGTPTTNSIIVTTSDSSVSGNSGTLSIDGGEQTVTFTGTMDSSGDLPAWIRVQAVLGVLSSGTSLTVDVAIRDVTYECATEIESGGDSTARQRSREEDTLYCGADGLSKSWTTGACDTLQEIHRDMIIRYAGVTTSTPDGYSALDTARSGWSGRLWLHKPTELKTVLEQIQFEGQFIFDWAPDGDPKYIFVKSSYTKPDVDLTIYEDIDTADGVDYSHTEMTNMVTQQEIKYVRHPADDRYLSSYTFTNSTARTNWNIQTKENIETSELDYLCAKADEFATVRDEVLGDVYATISCTLVRPRTFGVTTGDIVQVFGDTNYYMVTDERRTRQGVSIKARRVG